MADKAYWNNIIIKTTPSDANHAAKYGQLTAHTGMTSIHVPSSTTAGRLLVSANGSAPTWLSISTSVASTSTDAQVPSAKSVYAYVNSAIGALNLATTYAAASHNHAASEITSGTIASARLTSGTTSAKGIVQLTSSASAMTNETYAMTPKGVATYATATFAALSHTHTISEITDEGTSASLDFVTTVSSSSSDSTLPTALAVYTFVNANYATKSHSHTLSDISNAGTAASLAFETSLTTSSDTKIPTSKAVATYASGAYAAKTHTHSYIATSALITSVASSSTDAQVPSAKAVYTFVSTNYAPVSHTHPVAQVTGLGSAATKNIGTTSGTVPVLDANGKIPDSMITKTAIANTYTVATQAAMLALDADAGDIAIRTDESKTYILTSSDASVEANWKELLSPTSGVTSVNGSFGAVTLNFIDSSSLVTSVSSSSTNTTVPSALAVYDYAAPKSHSHAATAITSGTIAAARLPLATTSAVGGIKVGTGLAVASGVLSVGDLSSTYAHVSHTHSLSDITDEGTAALLTTSTSVSSSSTDSQAPTAKAVYTFVNTNYATKTHNHVATEITSGTIAAARLPAATTSAQGAVTLASTSTLSSDTSKAVTMAVMTNYATTNFSSKIHSHSSLSGSPTEFRAPVITNDPPTNSYLTPQTIIAPVYSSSATYAVGDYVMQTGILYKCITAVTTAGAFDDSKWTPVTVVDILSAMRYDGTITGNGSLTSFTITHNLGVKNVFCEVLDSDGHTVDVDIHRTSTSALSVIFGVAPASTDGTFAVIVRR